MKTTTISMIALAASLASFADTNTLSNTAADAVWIDSSKLSFEESVEAAAKLVRGKLEA